jgi:hypothetical protein
MTSRGAFYYRSIHRTETGRAEKQGINSFKEKVRQPLVPKHSSLEAETASEELKRYTLPCIDQILAERIQAGGKTLLEGIYYCTYL